MLRLRHIRLRAFTRAKTYGADLPLSAGLNIIHAGNTSGKSTCLQSIIYGLALERSLGPQLEVPLPYAMRERIHQHPTEPYDPVLQSYVELEIENAAGELLTIHRDVVGGADRKLIQTWDQPHLSSSGDPGMQRNFFVHDPGAAQREDGFHAFLARFIGWDLPMVPRYDGTECPLYLEAIFPMFFVEQKRGWSAIQGPFPTFMRIQDIARRVIEFLLDLDASRIRRERAELRRALAGIQQEWGSLRASLIEVAGPLIRIPGIPAQPTPEFAQQSDLRVEAFDDGRWRPLSEVRHEYVARIADLDTSEVPTAEAFAPEANEQLQRARARLEDLTSGLEALRVEFGSALQEHEAIHERLSILDIDLKRNQDALKLRRLGSTLGSAAADQICPTCHQDVSSELLPTITAVGMAIEENIQFIQSQITLYRSVLASSTERVEGLRGRFYTMDQEIRERRGEIRRLRQALVQPSAAPSRAVVEEIVKRQAFVDRLQQVSEKIDELMDQLRSIAERSAVILDRLQRLIGEDLTESDKMKLAHFETGVQTHLSRYGFRSFQPSEIKLSPDNFRPLIYHHEPDGRIIEKEIGFEVSASDAIRLKWAYYLSALSLTNNFMTNHCGLVVFDEPGQQEIEISSLHAMLFWSSSTLRANQQAIVATSEPIDSLQQAVEGSAANIIHFDGFLLQPIPS